MRLALIAFVCVTALLVFVGVVAASTILHTVPIAATATIVAPAVPEDVDGDGCVGPGDLALIARDLGMLGAPLVGADATDINVDGRVDISDVTLAALLFGTRTFGSAPCP